MLSRHGKIKKQKRQKDKLKERQKEKTKTEEREKESRERETENEAWVIEDNLEKHNSNSAKSALNPPKYPSEEGAY